MYNNIYKFAYFTFPKSMSMRDNDRTSVLFPRYKQKRQKLMVVHLLQLRNNYEDERINNMLSE